MTGEYETRALDLSDKGLLECARLLDRVFPHASHLTKEYLDWQYVQNPDGRAIGFNAYQRDVLAAHYVTIPVCARIGGNRHPGVLSLNTATHPEHQGKKLFTLLAEKTYDSAAAAGYDFVVGVANANSTPGFTRKLGFQLVGALEARLGIGRPPRESPEEAADFERVWDGASLAWRLSNPSKVYHLRAERSRFRVEAATERPGIKAFMGDFERDLEPAGTRGGSFGFRPVTLWIGIDPFVRWSRSLYFDIPRRFRRSPLNLIFKPLAKALELRREQVRFRALDFDPY
jgi:GNAT superfamily N-acetyltransferase